MKHWVLCLAFAMLVVSPALGELWLCGAVFCWDGYINYKNKKNV